MIIKQCYKSCIGIALLSMPLMVNAAPIEIFSTGVDDFNALLGPDVADPHYDVTVAPAGAGGTATAKDQATIPGPWVDNLATAQWISTAAAGTTNDLPGAYTYQTDFTLGPDAVIADAFIEGRWAVDNFFGRILLNGVEVVPAPVGPPTNNFFNLNNPFSISTGFVAGFNTLAFEFVNAGTSLNPTGILVAIDRTSDGEPAGTPIPAALWLFSFGLLGLFGKTRKRQS